MDTIGIGLIGSGLWGSIHAQAYAASPHSKLISVSDLDKDRAEQFAQKHGSDNWTTDYQELLSNPEISAISITTPDHTHTPCLRDASGRRCHTAVASLSDYAQALPSLDQSSHQKN